MNNFINYDNICDGITVGGISTVYVKRRSEIGRFWFYNQTSNLQYGEILGHSGTDNNWYLLVSDVTSITWNQTQSLTPSRNYDMVLKTQFNKMSIYNRDKFEQFVVCKDLVIIFQDNNGNWWLMGETNGCKVNFTAQTDTLTSGNNLFELTFICKERYPIRSVSQDYITEYIEIEPLNLCEVDISELCLTDISELCGIEI